MAFDFDNNVQKQLVELLKSLNELVRVAIKKVKDS
jgi:hypothetical protein